MDQAVQKYAEFDPRITERIASFYGVLGEVDRALDWLDKAARGGDDRADWLRRDPLLEGIRAHPRFQSMVESAANRRQQGVESTTRPH
jgi:hypothetical protein